VTADTIKVSKPTKINKLYTWRTCRKWIWWKKTI